MNERKNRDIVERLFELNQKGDLDGIFAHVDDDAVFEFPQSGERIQGKKDAIEMLRNYPEGMPSFTPRRILAAGDLVIAEADGRYPDGSTWFLVAIREFKNGLLVHETDYFSQEFEAPEWRTKWATKFDPRRRP